MCAAMLSGRNTARIVLSYLSGKKAANLMGIEVPETDEPARPSENRATDRQPPPAASFNRAPAAELTAAGSGRRIALDGIGVPAVLIFHTQETAAAASAVNLTVREKYPLASSVLVASMVDLRSVPRLFRSIAEGARRKAYQAGRLAWRRSGRFGDG